MYTLSCNLAFVRHCELAICSLTTYPPLSSTSPYPPVQNKGRYYDQRLPAVAIEDITDDFTQAKRHIIGDEN